MSSDSSSVQGEMAPKQPKDETIQAPAITEEEETAIEEIDSINENLDSLNQALDFIEDKADSIKAQLLELIMSNREILQSMKEENSK